MKKGEKIYNDIAAFALGVGSGTLIWLLALG